jgi:hypothetical protein
MAPGVQISEVKGNTRENRTATHSHIKGLGLRPDGTADKNAGGFVGQTAAREVYLHNARFIAIVSDEWTNTLLGRHAALLSISSVPKRCLAEQYY